MPPLPPVASAPAAGRFSPPGPAAAFRHQLTAN